MSDIRYSTDDSGFCYSSVEEALDEFDVGQVVEILEGRAVETRASSYCDFGSGTLADRALYEVGDFADGWPCTSAAQEEDLLEMIKVAVDKWADKHGVQPTFFSVTDVRPLKVEVKEDGSYIILDD